MILFQAKQQKVHKMIGFKREIFTISNDLKGIILTGSWRNLDPSGNRCRSTWPVFFDTRTVCLLSLTVEMSFDRTVRIHRVVVCW